MRLLDLFCGAGGAAMGYHRAGFEVVGIDIKPQPHYPFEFHQADALEYCREHGKEFDAIHASPPCQAYTGMRAITIARYGVAPEHPKLIEPTRQVLIYIGKPYVIENVTRAPIITQIILCGSALGLNELSRHRHFESNILLFAPKCQCRGKNIVGVYGAKPDGRRVTCRKYYHGQGVARGLAEGQRVMNIDWMNWDELRLAIPPQYSEFIGKQLMQYLTYGKKKTLG